MLVAAMAVVVIVVGRGGRGGGSISACCPWSSMAMLCVLEREMREERKTDWREREKECHGRDSNI